LLPRAQRREQILLSATRAFARAGFAATGLEDVAAEARVSRDILYRHFESKADLYRAVLSRAQDRLGAATGAPDFTPASLDELLAAAAEEPAAFRLLFHHAAREPEFRQEMDELRACMFDVTFRQLADVIPDPAWARWASSLVPTTAVEGVIAWLDAGQPDPATAASRIGEALLGIVQAARSEPGDMPQLPPACPI
jgi:AcrR family transcriptional regulator